MFKQNLVDLKDKPASRQRTYERIQKYMIHNMFTLDSDDVEQACARSMIEILECTFPDLVNKEQPNDEKISFIPIFLTPLLNLMTSTSSQNFQNAGASRCVHELAKHLILNHEDMVTSAMLGILTLPAIVSTPILESPSLENKNARDPLRRNAL